MRAAVTDQHPHDRRAMPLRRDKWSRGCSSNDQRRRQFRWGRSLKLEVRGEHLVSLLRAPENETSGDVGTDPVQR